MKFHFSGLPVVGGLLTTFYVGTKVYIFLSVFYRLNCFLFPHVCSSNNILHVYLQIMFYIEEAKKRSPWTRQMHDSWCKFLFTARSFISYTEQFVWLGGICGYESWPILQIDNVLYIKFGNHTFRFCTQYKVKIIANRKHGKWRRKKKEVNLLNIG
jgi:hypothetical protein